MSEDDELAILKLAFEESVRKLGLPSDAANTIRARAATVMATATAVAGFLGGLAFNRSPHGCQWALVSVAASAYAGLMTLCLVILIPRFNAWKSGQDTELLAKSAGTPGTNDVKEVYRTLAIDYQKGLEANESVTHSLAKMLSFAIGLMAVELVFLLWLVAATATATHTIQTLPVL